MVTNYHRQVENVLVELGNEWTRINKIRKVNRGNSSPLSIVDPRSKNVLNYQPDVYYILRNNRKLVFEILDSELEKQDGIVADVICSFLAENVDGLFFIYPGPESAEKTILEALKTIFKGLVNKGIEVSELPHYQKTGAYLVTKKEASNSTELSIKLKKYAAEDKWLKSWPYSKESR